MMRKQEVESTWADILKHACPWLDEREQAETPKRFLKYLQEFNHGKDLKASLGTPFDNEGKIDQMVVQTQIPFRGVCSHHLLPMFGEASIGYLPNKKIVGLSKLARLVDAAGTRKPSLQEVISNDIADTLESLEPKGVIVVIRALHTCMAVRGVVAEARTTTSTARGAFLLNPQARQEFFELCKQGRGSHQ